jgi:hypothetical protein
LRPDVPAGLNQILLRLMAKQPDDRFRTPAAVALALAPYCRGDGVRLDPAPLLRPITMQGQILSPEDTPLAAALDGDAPTSPRG